MKCPVCDTSSLSQKHLDQDLLTKRCSNCAGHWISSPDYLNYLKKQKSTAPKNPFDEITSELTDSVKAKMCPDCGHILTKFKVGHGINFYLDHCHTCNGIWLDKNEWEVLFKRGLHDELNKVFTTKWQKLIREEEYKKNMEKVYENHLGGENFKEIKKFKNLISKHPKKSLILAYLNE